MLKPDEGFPEGCPIGTTFKLINGKWKLRIIHRLFGESKRFNELNRLIPEISRQMLTQNLRELEADGLVHREVYAEMPPRVEYKLTEMGCELLPILLAMENWGKSYLAQTSEYG